MKEFLSAPGQVPVGGDFGDMTGSRRWWKATEKKSSSDHWVERPVLLVPDLELTDTISSQMYTWGYDNLP
jgi:hypothetical protein